MQLDRPFATCSLMSSVVQLQILALKMEALTAAIEQHNTAPADDNGGASYEDDHLRQQTELLSEYYRVITGDVNVLPLVARHAPLAHVSS